MDISWKNHANNWLPLTKKKKKIKKKTVPVKIILTKKNFLFLVCIALPTTNAVVPRVDISCTIMVSIPGISGGCNIGFGTHSIQSCTNGQTL